MMIIQAVVTRFKCRDRHIEKPLSEGCHKPVVKTLLFPQQVIISNVAGRKQICINLIFLQKRRLIDSSEELICLKCFCL